MKQRILTILLLFATFLQVQAQQKVYVHTLDKIFEWFTWEVDSITFKEADPLVVPATAKPVDLGLSVQWADINLGANSETERGFLVGWGDVTGINRSVNLKYFPVEQPVGNIIITKYDIAKQKWGDQWRLPSTDEIQELIDHCTWTWTTKNGVTGYQVSSQQPENTNSIFIPVSGFRTGSVMAEEDVAGYYWSGILDTDNTNAVALKFTDTDKQQTALKRFVGCSVRPVYGKYVQAVYAVTAPAAEITYQTANVNVSLSGGLDQVKEYGVCYAKNPVDLDPIKGPKVSDTTIPEGNTKTFVLTDLSQRTTYYYQAYALVGSDYVYGEKLQFTTQPKFPEPEIVDLGLSVKWAKWNMGAKTEADYGGYFGWGDPTGELFSNDVTEYAKGLATKDIGGTKYDIARAQWGGKWRLPTTKELKELEKCTWAYTPNYNNKGIEGWIVSNNGKQLFFPRAGWRRADNTSHGIGDDAYYWSSELADNSPNSAKYAQLIGKNFIEITLSYKSILLPVRAVYAEPGENVTPDPTPDPGGDPTPTPNPGQEPTPDPPSPTAGVAVDLGVSVKWADRNVGAVTATDAGKYFAWAEVTDKSTYTKESYTAGYDTTTGTFTDLVSVNHIQGSKFDAARSLWGGKWRMPTDDEVEELNNRCTMTWTFKNGVPGYEITNKANPKNSIFLPAAGYISNGTSVSGADSFGKYWTDRLYTYKDSTRSTAYALSISNGSFYCSSLSREYGAPIRPVMDY
ncbi:hypothetical protein [Hoylesella timonensis]